MGVSTNAIMYFGFDILDKESGISKLLPIIEKNINYDPWEAYDKDVKKFVVDILEVNIDSHCHCDFPVWYICATPSQVKAYRGYPEEILLPTKEEMENYKNSLKEACRLLSIDYSEEKDFKLRIASYSDY